MTYSFFQLIGHSIPTELQRQTFDCAERFFALSLEEKLNCARRILLVYLIAVMRLLVAILQEGMLLVVKEVGTRNIIFRYFA